DRKKTGVTASEERVNVDRRWLGTSVGRVRVLAAGLVLLGAGYAVLGWSAHSRQSAANVAAQMPAIHRTTVQESEQPIVPDFWGTAVGLSAHVDGEAESR